MKPKIIWSFPALAMIYRLPWRTAELIDAAVIRFAETGKGRVQWVAPHYRLYAGPYEMALAIDRKARTVTVLYIYRARV